MMSGRAKKKEYELLALELWTKSYVWNRESYINENTLAHAMKTVERSAINVDSASERSSSGSVCCFIRPLLSGDSSRKHWIIFLSPVEYIGDPDGGKPSKDVVLVLRYALYFPL